MIVRNYSNNGRHTMSDLLLTVTFASLCSLGLIKMLAARAAWLHGAGWMLVGGNFKKTDKAVADKILKEEVE